MLQFDQIIRICLCNMKCQRDCQPNDNNGIAVKTVNCYTVFHSQCESSHCQIIIS